MTIQTHSPGTRNHAPPLPAGHPRTRGRQCPAPRAPGTRDRGRATGAMARSLGGRLRTARVPRPRPQAQTVGNAKPPRRCRGSSAAAWTSLANGPASWPHAYTSAGPPETPHALGDRLGWERHPRDRGSGATQVSLNSSIRNAHGGRAVAAGDAGSPIGLDCAETYIGGGSIQRAALSPKAVVEIGGAIAFAELRRFAARVTYNVARNPRSTIGR